MQARQARQTGFVKRRSERGQALVESALSITVLILLLSGLIDVGRAVYTYIAIHNAVAEGAYYGSAFPARLNSLSTSESADPNNVTFRTKNEVPEALSQLVKWDQATVTPVYSPLPTNPRPGDQLIVSAEVTFNTIGPLPGLLGWSGQFPIRATAIQTIVGNPTDP